MLVGKLGTKGKRQPFGIKRPSFPSKENKKGLSHFNLNGIITLGSNALYGYHKTNLNSKIKTGKRAKQTNGFNFSVLKKNLSSKQKVLYSSLNQTGGRIGYNRSQK